MLIGACNPMVCPILHSDVMLASRLQVPNFESSDESEYAISSQVRHEHIIRCGNLDVLSLSLSLFVSRHHLSHTLSLFSLSPFLLPFSFFLSLSLSLFLSLSQSLSSFSLSLSLSFSVSVSFFLSPFLSFLVLYYSLSLSLLHLNVPFGRSTHKAHAPAYCTTHNICGALF